MNEEENKTKTKKENTNKGKKSKSKKYTIIVILLVIILLIVASMTVIYIKTNNRQDLNNYKPSGVFEPSQVMKKPIIYIYPENQVDVKVILGKPENLIYTYPKYENSWEVNASPNGNLIDLKTGRNQYALYWEGKKDENKQIDNNSKGFIIEGKDTITFLEEKLEVLGLNEREANEFIIYWLPQLEGNAYNYIRFQTIEEIEEQMPLEITPKPETTIRVMMEYKPLEKKIEVSNQQLQRQERKGYTVVEWGGIKLN